MEYAKTGNLQVSDQFFSHTLSICAMDPLVFNEIGVLRYLQVVPWPIYDSLAFLFRLSIEYSGLCGLCTLMQFLGVGHWLSLNNCRGIMKRQQRHLRRSSIFLQCNWWIIILRKLAKRHSLTLDIVIAKCYVFKMLSKCTSERFGAVPTRRQHIRLWLSRTT